ncbi:MAG: topoisomerase C-terminal repeat-containing protein, partial [Armatimonadota bacterium]
LVPTWRAFMAMEVLDVHFHELMDFGFTARLDDTLDEISEGKSNSKDYLKEFFIGDASKPGLKPMVEERKLQIPFPNLQIGKDEASGEDIRVRTGKDGSPFLQLGEQKVYANIPDDLAPADLTLAKAHELFAQKAPASETIGVHPDSGRNLLLKHRQGYYIEVERTPEEIEKKVKPTWVSLPPAIAPQDLTSEEIDMLCRYPRLIGKDGSNEVWFKMGKFGPYVEGGTERRTVEDWRKGGSMTLEEAQAILALPKTSGGGAKKGALKEMGEIAGCAGPVKVMTGFYGPYVTDGVTNATIPKSIDPLSLTNEQAAEMLQKKRDAPPSTKKRGAFKKKAPATKRAAPKKK